MTPSRFGVALQALHLNVLVPAEAYINAVSRSVVKINPQRFADMPSGFANYISPVLLGAATGEN